MKTTKEMIEVMKAFEEGKTIQAKGLFNDEDWFDCDEPLWGWQDSDYRIKPEKKYRPFNNIQELVNYWDEHHTSGTRPKEVTMPLIWVKHKGQTESLLVQGFSEVDNGVFFLVWCAGIYGKFVELDELFNDFTFLNGKPCGVKI